MDILARPATNMKHKNTPHKSCKNQMTQWMEKMKEKTNIIIPPRGVHTVPVYLEAGESIKWEFSVQKYDINFSVVFRNEEKENNIDDDDDDDWKEKNDNIVDDIVVEEMRVESDDQITQTGRLTAMFNGTLTLTWNNSYSLLRKKVIQVSIYPILENNNHQTSPSNGTQGGLSNSTPNTTTPSPLWLNKNNDIPTEEITFMDYFQLSNMEKVKKKNMKIKKSALFFKPPDAKKHTKHFSATLHMSPNFPISVDAFLPIMQVLAKTSNHFEYIEKFFHSVSTI